MATFPFEMGTVSFFSPVKKTAKRLSASEPSKVRLTVSPGLAGAVTLRVGKAFTGRLGFESGQPVMKGAARE